MRNSEDDICSVKLTEGGAQSIYCDVCSKIYCLKCMGIQKKNFDFISNNNNIKMVCNQCLKFSFTLICQEKVRENKFNEKCLEMDAIIKRFEDVGEKIEQSIDIKITEKLMNKMEAKLERKIEDIPQEMDRTYSKVLQNHVREENDKTIVKSVSEAVRTTIIENKKTQDKETETERSAIIYDLKEDDVKNYDSRIESDMVKLSNLINNGIKIQMPDMIKVYRIGKYNTNRRVPRVVFQDKFERNKVVRNASNLKEAEKFYKKCYITKDMNPEEREEYHKQMKKAKELAENEENKGKFYVVRGYPTKWRIEERVRHTTN